MIPVNVSKDITIPTFIFVQDVTTHVLNVMTVVILHASIANLLLRTDPIIMDFVYVHLAILMMEWTKIVNFAIIVVELA